MAPTIEHLVVLMLENRSFDHMLGFLQTLDYGIDGLLSGFSNPSTNGGPDIPATRAARTSGDLIHDPAHDFVNTNVQIFGNPQGTVTGRPLMNGFVQDYTQIAGSPLLGANIMKCFDETNLPVLSTLAKQYAVCDRWFAAVPSSTQPNRMFAHAANSLGSLVQDPDWYELKTIFELLDSDPTNPNDYRIYKHDAQTLLITVKHLIEDQHGLREFNQFDRDCARGDLPAYTFIEPLYSPLTINGSLFLPNDQHPNNDVAEGEALIAQVYRSITQNRQLWNGTLLLIVYDEHGGIVDHAVPPVLDPPFLPPAVDPPFSFNRLGVRVPAVLVSPYIRPQTIDHTQYEHSSIVKTVRKLFAPSSAPLTVRDASSKTNTFDGILNLASPRDDIASFAALQNVMPAAAGDDSTARFSTSQQKPSELVMNMARSMHHTLARLGKPTPPSLHTIYSRDDVSAFMKEAGRILMTRPTDAY